MSGRHESDVVNNPVIDARIKDEGCLSCGGPVRVAYGSVMCMDCESLVGVDAYRKFFAVKAGYEDVPTQDNAPR